MPQYAPVKLKRCLLTWRSTSWKVSESVIGENCGTWMCPWFQCLSSLSGLMPPIDVVVSCSIWSLTHPFEEKRPMGRVPFAWETISINGLGSTDPVGASTGWDIYLTIAACGVGLPQYAPVCPSMPQWNLSVAYWPECQQAWRLRAGKVSEPVVGENCGTWMRSWFQCLSSLSGLILPIDVVNDRGISKSPENVLTHSKCSKHSGDAFGHLQVVKIKSWAQRNLALPGATWRYLALKSTLTEVQNPMQSTAFSTGCWS